MRGSAPVGGERNLVSAGPGKGAPVVSTNGEAYEGILDEKSTEVSFFPTSQRLLFQLEKWFIRPIGWMGGSVEGRTRRSSRKPLDGTIIGKIIYLWRSYAGGSPSSSTMYNPSKSYTPSRLHFPRVNPEITGLGHLHTQRPPPNQGACPY